MNEGTKRLLKGALKNSLAEVEEALSAEGVDVNATDRDGRTPLMSAVISKNAAMVRKFIAVKANVNAQDKQGWTALHFAAQAQDSAIAQLLLDAGASLDQMDVYGNTPLWRAVFAYQNQGDLPAIFLAHGARPDEPNNSDISPRQLANQIANYDAKKFFK